MGLKNLYRSSARAWEEGIKKAVAQNVITEPEVNDDNLSFPMMILSFMGALVAALIFLTFFILLFLIEGDGRKEGIFSCCIGAVCLIFAVLFCRLSKGISNPFRESLSLSGIMVGMAMLVMGEIIVSRDWNQAHIYLCLASMSLICTCLVPKNWMRTIGGFASAIFLHFWLFSFFPHFYFDNGSIDNSIYIGLSLIRVFCVPFIAVGGFFLIFYFEKHARWARALWLKPIVNGLLAAVVVIPVFSYAQLKFTDNAVISWDFYGSSSSISSLGPWDIFKQNGSNIYFWVTIALLYGAWFLAARQCTLLKSKRIMALLVVATVFSMFTPALALCVGIALLTYANKQYKLAVLAGLACLFIIAKGYVSMQMPLEQIAIWLAVMAVFFIGVSWGVDKQDKNHLNLKAQPELSRLKTQTDKRLSRLKTQTDKRLSRLKTQTDKRLSRLKTQKDKRQPMSKKGNIVLLAVAVVAICVGCNGYIF